MSPFLQIETILYKTQLVALGLAILGVPALAWSRYARTPDDVRGSLMAGFLTVITLERVWETFFTGTPEDRKLQHSDRNLTAATIANIVMLYGTALEFFGIRKSLNPWMSLVG